MVTSYNKNHGSKWDPSGNAVVIACRLQRIIIGWHSLKIIGSVEQFSTRKNLLIRYEGLW